MPSIPIEAHDCCLMESVHAHEGAGIAGIYCRVEVGFVELKLIRQACEPLIQTLIGLIVECSVLVQPHACVLARSSGCESPHIAPDCRNKSVIAHRADVPQKSSFFNVTAIKDGRVEWPTGVICCL